MVIDVCGFKRALRSPSECLIDIVWFTIQLVDGVFLQRAFLNMHVMLYAHSPTCVLETRLLHSKSFVQKMASTVGGRKKKTLQKSYPTAFVFICDWIAGLDCIFWYVRKTSAIDLYAPGV